jgi:hypothetical protein
VCVSVRSGWLKSLNPLSQTRQVQHWTSPNNLILPSPIRATTLSRTIPVFSSHKVRLRTDGWCGIPYIDDVETRRASISGLPAKVRNIK